MGNISGVSIFPSGIVNKTSASIVTFFTLFLQYFIQWLGLNFSFAFTPFHRLIPESDFSVGCNERMKLFGYILIHSSSWSATVEPVTKIIFYFHSRFYLERTELIYKLGLGLMSRLRDIATGLMQTHDKSKKNEYLTPTKRWKQEISFVIKKHKPFTTLSST